MPSMICTPAPRWLIACGGFFFRYRNYAFPAVLLGMLLLLRPQLLYGTEVWDRWLDWLGALIAFGGQALRAATIGFAYIKRGGLNKQVYADRLVTGGLFGVCRNPLYLGNALILLGLLVVFNHPVAYLCGIGFFGFAYHAIVRTEESYLLAKFGAEYRNYCGRVNRWLPDLARLRPALAGMRFSWRRVVLKDYGSTAGWLCIALLLEDYEEILWEQLSLLSGALAPSYGAIAAIALAAAAIRGLKKSGRLREAA